MNVVIGPHVADCIRWQSGPPILKTHSLKAEVRRRGPDGAFSVGFLYQRVYHSRATPGNVCFVVPRPPRKYPDGIGRTPGLLNRQPPHFPAYARGYRLAYKRSRDPRTPEKPLLCLHPIGHKSIRHQAETTQNCNCDCLALHHFPFISNSMI